MKAQALQLQLADRVRDLRKERGWSRRDLAQHAAISERFLADIESGRANPSLLRLCELAEALHTTPHGLLTPSGDQNRRVVALLGLRGAGKSTIGERLAQALGCEFVELDRLVEDAAGVSLAEMFELHGETFYRETEHRVLSDLLDRAEPLVVATGGGIVNSERSFALLEARAHTVWLRADPEDHWTRVVAQGDTRPMADNERAFADLCAILAQREPLYRKAQHLVETSGRSTEDVTEELARHFAFLHDGA